MTFPQLQYVLEINHTGSVSQAAKNLFVSQSSVSVALSSLEKELGFPIFIRSRKGLLPTERGANVIHHAAAICESHRLMTAPVQGGCVNMRISAVSIPPVQKAFLRLVQENRERRDIFFSLSSEPDSMKNLKVFNLEMAFLMVLSPHLLSIMKNIQDYGLEATNICTFPGAIKIGKGHRLFQAETITAADLENDLFLDSRDAEVSSAMLSAGLFVTPERTISSMQYGVRKELVLSGLAYEIAPYIPAIHDKQEEFRYIPLEGVSYKVIACTNPQHPTMPEITRFMELLRQEVKAAGLQES